jgi:NADPH-dependent ferric siderophore reductase
MANRNQQVAYPIYVRDLEVLESFDVTPSMRRVVLGGEQLGAFESNGYQVTPFFTDNADDHVKVVIPSADGRTDGPGQLDGHLDWTREQLGRARDYTPRRYDPVTGRLELDFVRHDGGHAAEWAVNAKPGDRIPVAGPRGTTIVPDDVDWYLLVGDDTALPAIARRIEELPAGTPVSAVVLVPTAADEQEFDHQTDLTITWLHRDKLSPGAVNEVVLEAVQATKWRDGQVYAWAAGEASMLRPIRRWLKEDRLVDRGHTDISGYWRAGQDQEQMAVSQMQLRERVDLAFPYAVRAAVTLGVAELVADGVTSLTELADRTGTDRRGLRKIIRLLAHEGYFSLSESDVVGLTSTGPLLTEDFVHNRLDRASGYARLDDSWPGLLHAIRTGRSGFQQSTGSGFWETLSADSRLSETFDDVLATWSADWADAVVTELEITDGVLVDVGGGTGTLLERLLLAVPSARGTLVELPTTAARAREQFTASGVVDRVTIVEQSFFEPLPAGGDHYLLAQVLHDWPDAEAKAILRRIAEVAGAAPIHIIERLPSADDHDHDLTFDLQLYATFGGGERTQAEYAALAEQAGMRLDQVRQLNEELYLFTLHTA